MKVWTLTINHKHGSDVSVYVSKEAATIGLAEYVDNWWQREMGDEVRPADNIEAIEAYFDGMNGVETADIHETELKGLDIEDLKAITNVAEAFNQDMGDDEEFTEQRTDEAINRVKALIKEVSV